MFSNLFGSNVFSGNGSHVSELIWQKWAQDHYILFTMIQLNSSLTAAFMAAVLWALLRFVIKRR